MGSSVQTCVAKRMLPALLMMVASSGCAIVMASKLPIARPPAQLAPDVDREFVDHHYGFPVAIGISKQGNYTEQIQFIDGVSIGEKTARYCIHGALDALSYCIWEVVGTPYEMMNSDFKTYVYFIEYDSENRIISAVDADSPAGADYKDLPWAKPMIEGLKVNKDPSIRNSR